MHPRWYQLPKGREITFDPASTINIELHNAAVDAYVNESLEYRRIHSGTYSGEHHDRPGTAFARHVDLTLNGIRGYPCTYANDYKV